MAEDVQIQRRRHSRGAEDDDLVAGVLVARWRYRAKIKTPFELVISAARAAGSDVIRRCAGAVDGRIGDRLSMPAADRLRGQG